MKSNFFLSLLTGLFLICAPPLANAQEQGIIDIEPNEIRDKVQGEDYENIYRISNLTITFIQTSTYGTTIYAQNDNGGIQIRIPGLYVLDILRRDSLMPLRAQ